MLLEQPTPEEDTAVPEEPAAPDMAAPAPDATTPPAPDATAPPAPDATATPAPAPTNTTAAQPQQTITQQFGSELQNASNNFERIGKIKEVIGVALEKAIETEEPAAVNEFYKFLIKDLIKQRHEMFAKFKNKK